MSTNAGRLLGADCGIWRAARRYATGQSRGFVIGTMFYAAIVAGLVIASFRTEDTAGPALYLTAGGLTFPAFLLVYPALWVNSIMVGGLTRGLMSEVPFSFVGVTLIFTIAAIGNAFLLRALWKAVRQLFH